MKNLVIAIDGYSSTGKSSISQIIAEKLGLLHLDTGALYRAITYYALQHCKTENNEIDFQKLFSDLPTIHLEFRNIDNKMILFLNGKNIEKEIRDPEVSQHVSTIAKEQKVRDFLLDNQRNLAIKGGIIMDGRDIGTVILPDADFKFFLTASVAERARRRFLELQTSGISTDLETVSQNLIDRDKTDSERSIAPLIMATDAILVDNTLMNKEETIDYILKMIQEKN